MSKLTVDVIFCKNLEFNYDACVQVKPGKSLSEAMPSEYIEVGRLANVTVEIKDDVTPEQIEALKAKKQDIAAKAQVEMNNLDEQIQSLLAIECDS